MSEILLKKLDKTFMDLSFNDSFMTYYKNPTSYTKHIIDKEINNEHYFDKDFLDIFKSDDAVVIDAGANIGLFSLHIYSKCKDVYAVEPTPAHIDVLRQIIAHNDIKNIHLEELALCNFTGTTTFSIDNQNTTQNRIANHGNIVKCETLLDFLNNRKIEKVDLLKIDIEGGEKLLFLEDKTFDSAISKCSNIYIELHPPHIEPSQIINRIKGMGFNIKYMNSKYLDNNLNILCTKK